MRVLLLERDHARYAELLSAAAPDLQLLAGEQATAGEAQACSVWLGQPDLLLPLLRQGLRPDWLQSTWAGITPLLGIGLPRDYRLTRAVGIFGQPMAEYVLTYLLAHRRRVLARLASQVEQRWDNQAPPSLRGCKVLVVGAGDIGSDIARFLLPFGAELRGIARQPRAIVPFAEVHGLDALAEQAAWADCLVNVLPDTPATRDLCDAALFAGMRAEALFINAGRGVAVVDADLVAALRTGQLAGAVIDVCREEPLPPGHPFWDAPRLLLTGHSSAPTEPAAMARLFLDNLQRYRDGQALRGEVEFARGY
ncbi:MULTISPECIES: D-2-hydroxyacid dehydrogenase [unclassified Pseudomonas]|uniref:D-2-hydroxyacid dehydrogenase n=1 Tax=unclassified Pseudomonas TaxID=196821 RepID=UPI00244D45C7|nr:MULTISPECIES: D-2-hydroxyacid dehydrogenase [unclassified Pseudomonas]MDG9922705.1 D-2-hydroxyacid dehydrogenase [Pseudomonas sp. GD04045]MDH0033162.1 D-2-hydroxyacid dehydrogenase [Pseudomonas sp. GD04019]